MARAMSSCAPSSMVLAPGLAFWRCTPKRRRETDKHEVRSFPSHLIRLDLHSRRAAHHRRRLWQSGAGPRRRSRRGDEDKSVSADGTHAKLLGFLSRARAGGHNIPYCRIDSLLATGLAGKDGRAAPAPAHGYVFSCVCRDCRELVQLLLSRPGNFRDLDRGVPRIGDCYREASSKRMPRRPSALDWRALPFFRSPASGVVALELQESTWDEARD